MRERDIRPKELFDRYLELSKQDAKAIEKDLFVEVSCPGCANDLKENRFEKDRFQFVKCLKCGTLYCSPRPNENSLNAFYKNSKSAKFWSTVFFPTVAEFRRNKLFRKKVRKIYDYLKKKNFYPNKICDVGAGNGIFLEELKVIYQQSSLYAIEPSEDSAAQCRKKGFKTYEFPVEEMGTMATKDCFDLVISSEVVEHVYSTDSFIKSLYNLTAKSGYCLVTGLGYEGFDILTLQQNSNSISPPQHINFLSIKGYESAFYRNGFRDIEVSTPGELDLNIVLNHDQKSEFIRVLAERGDDAKNEFQQFLKKYKLSSHTWVWAKK